MSQVRLIRVFLSSPGDVTEERQIALEEIERLPNHPAFREKVSFRVIAWDKPEARTPMRATMTPQEAIDKGLPRPSECDIVIVLFWSRMGTPFTLEDQEYQPGTHWEPLDALNSKRAETVIYRRTEQLHLRHCNRHLHNEHMHPSVSVEGLYDLIDTTVLGVEKVGIKKPYSFAPCSNHSGLQSGETVQGSIVTNVPLSRCIYSPPGQGGE